MQVLRNTLREWFSVDVRSLAVFRMATALLILADVAVRVRDLEAHYADSGLVSRELLYRTSWQSGYWSVHALSGEIWFQGGIFALTAIFAVMLLLGYQTRFAAIASWILMASLHTRAPYVMQSGDTLMRLMLFWGIFLPMGAVWSVDSKRRGGGPVPGRVLWLATFCILMQVCVVYWFTMALRLPSTVWWPDGRALWMALMIDAYTSDLGRMLLALDGVLVPLTLVACIVEGFGPFLVFSPWKTQHFRLVAFALFLGTHLLFGALMVIGLFWLISIVSWLVFLPPLFWDKLAARFPVLAVDLSDEVAGTLYRPGGSPAIRRFRVFGVNAFLALCLLATSAWNVRTLDARNGFRTARHYFPTTWNTFPNFMRLDQYWAMYSPYPSTDDGWFVAVGVLSDGREVDLWSGNEPVTFDKPEDVAGSYRNQRWRKLLFNLWRPDKTLVRQPLSDFLHDEWALANPGGPRVVEVRLVWVLERTKRTRAAPPEQKMLGRWTYR